ncbi:MAG TPA: GGDEF domain-containing protein, partial [Roseiflexaceae bacterium]|nr:GGDEF domain-containing protein [Roseiflexaceae bacterium]
MTTPPFWIPIQAWLRSTTQALTRRQRVWIGLALTVALAALDLASGPDLSLSLFYVLPLGLVAWNARRATAFVLISLIATAWVLENAPVLDRPQWILGWNIMLRTGFFAVIVMLIARLRLSHDRERRLARYDALTGLLNRFGFDEAATVEIRRALRARRPLAIAYVDLDNFKQVNDRLGHSAGDRLLAALAATMRQSLRITDIVARIGGDEFVLLLPETGDEAARTILTRLQQAIDTEAARLNSGVTASMGAVIYYRPPEQVDTLLRAADEIMYLVKQTSKNDVS